MLSFNIPMKALDDGISIILRIEANANMKCTRKMFSIILPPTSRRRFTAAFQMAPQFFTRFTCNCLHYAIFSLDDLYTLMLDMQRVGFSSLTLSLSKHSDLRVVAALEFHYSYAFKGDEEKLGMAMLPTFKSENEEDVGEIDYTYFVSIEIEDFKGIVKELGDDDEVSVVLTNAHIKFSVGWRVITLTTMSKECIIGGIAVGEEIQTSISFNPMHFFYNFKSKRVWFFKSNDRGIILTGPMGLYARISSYFPDRL